MKEKKKKMVPMYSNVFYSEGGIVEFVEMLDKNAGRNSLIPK
jgi:DNA gyrase subunit B